MPERRKWDLERLNEYINSGGFKTTDEKDAVLRELKVSEILNEYLGTIQGMIIMDSVVDSVRENMMKIVSLSISGSKENEDAIKQASLQIGIARDFMFGILTALERGMAHEKAMGE